MLVYFEGCPGVRTAEERLREALVLVGRSEVVVQRRMVTTAEEAEATRFAGSPTVVVDGRDPFASADQASPAAAVGLSCRLYPTPAGLAGSPTLDQLVEVLR